MNIQFSIGPAYGDNEAGSRPDLLALPAESRATLPGAGATHTKAETY
jgi:hypothetical protein